MCEGGLGFDSLYHKNKANRPDIEDPNFSIELGHLPFSLGGIKHLHRFVHICWLQCSADSLVRVFLNKKMGS